MLGHLCDQNNSHNSCSCVQREDNHASRKQKCCFVLSSRCLLTHSFDSSSVLRLYYIVEEFCVSSNVFRLILKKCVCSC